MAVNIVPAATVQPLRIGGRQGRFRGDFAGLDVAQLERELAAAGRGQDEDQALRELALLLGAGQQRDELRLMREQMAQQGEQFTESLEAQQEQFEADRGLRQQETDRLGEELDFMREQYELTVSLEQADDDLSKAFRLFDQAAALGDLEINERADSARRTVGTTLDTFAAGVNNLLSITAEIETEDSLERNLPDIADALEAFERNLENTLTDDSAPIDQRVGAATALVAQTPLSPEGLTLPGVMLSELARLRPLAGKREQKQIDDLTKRLRGLGRLGFQASRVTAAFTESIAADPAKAQMLRQRIEAEEQLATELQRVQTEGGRLPLQRPQFAVPVRGTSDLEAALSGLAGEFNPTSSGNPLPDAKAGDLQSQLEQIQQERTTLTEEIREAARTEPERVELTEQLSRAERMLAEEKSLVERMRAEGRSEAEIKAAIGDLERSRAKGVKPFLRLR
jgi:hypothetical protein